MSVKCLCKIGILKSNQIPKNKEFNDDSLIIHNHKLYKLYSDLDRGHISSVSRHKDFCVVALKCDDAEYLTIFHDGSRSAGKDRWSRQSILSICFPDFWSHMYEYSPVTDENWKNNRTKKIHEITAKLYYLLKEAHSQNSLEEQSNSFEEKISKIDRLKPQLRNYQRKSLQWLLRRELLQTTMSHFYKKMTSAEGHECYVNLLNLDLTEESPKNIAIPSGGILAEEMGLGKTVEMLSLILLNPRVLKTITPEINNEPEIKKQRISRAITRKLLCLCQSTKLKDTIVCSKCQLSQHQSCIRSYIDFPLVFDETSKEQAYICPKCWATSGILVDSGATVIVSPNSIKLQWLSEINKHTDPPLKVILYEGVAKQTISPKELASYDIVLTDYSILRSEIHFTASNETSISFRNERKRMRVNSPLVLVNWWRVCLDEAQMESSKTQASQIVRQLPTIHRWAVTGTPVQNSLDDLITLLEFIGFEEASDTWKELTSQFHNGQFDNITKILQKVMWRTCKVDVVNELQIPPQSELIHFVEMNDVEKLFYSDEHAECLSAFYEKIDKLIKDEQNLDRVSTKLLNLILQPMLKLRQDCSIPVVLLKGEQKLQKVKKFLQPQELLNHMKTTNEIECKSQLRSMASIHNGMAALYFLKKDYKEAIDYYERVMNLAKKFNGSTISVDSLLQIHALSNAIQAYRTISSEDTPIIGEYEVECNKLEWKYLQPYAANLQGAYKAYVSALEKSNEKMENDSCEIWENIFREFENKNLDEQLLNKINEEVSLLHSSSLYERFGMLGTVMMALELWYTKIINVRKELSYKFDKFDFFIENVRPRRDVSVATWRRMNEFIRSVYDCHLSEIRKTNKNQETNGKNKSKNEKLCRLCEAEKLLQKYECLIFNKTLDEKTSNAEGTWNPTMQETILKTIFSSVKQKHELKDFIKDCEVQLEAISLMKTEYKELVKFWIEIEYTVKAYDEIDMCKMRISLANLDEEKTNYSIYEYEIEDVLDESRINFDVAQKEFVVKHARLKYIQHLQGNTDPGPCPICRSEAQMKYVVLECGHHLCLYCLKTLSQLNKTAKITCSICRNQQKYQNVHYVTRKMINNEGFDIKGDYSSKIQKILLEVFKLKTKDKNVKIIMFSQWMPILQAIGEALKENDINFKINTHPKCVEEFKNESLDITCLLMLLHKKAQGLNLTEATNVFLIEPILNFGEELQAIGRVHRIGQTKATFVHRFIVKNTIEENIHNALSKDKTKKTFDLTIDSIKKLFEMHSNDA